jgi:hypothetical protein
MLTPEEIEEIKAEALECGLIFTVSEGGEFGSFRDVHHDWYVLTTELDVCLKESRSGYLRTYIPEKGGFADFF